jgi:hypothetical protein
LPAAVCCVRRPHQVRWPRAMLPLPLQPACSGEGTAQQWLAARLLQLHMWWCKRTPGPPKNLRLPQPLLQLLRGLQLLLLQAA